MKQQVPPALAGERLDRALALMTQLPRATVAELIDSGEVLLSGKPAKSRSMKVNDSQWIEVTIPERVDGPPVADESIQLDIIYEDEDIAVVNKQAGLVVHPGSAHESDTLVNALMARYPEMSESLPGDPERPGIVHRLDSGTSGLLIVARTQRAYDALVALMKNRDVDRRYLAMVWGDVQPSDGVIDAPIGRSERDRTKMAVASGGREARTHYSVVQRKHEPDISLVEAKLETGRTHQIRVHFAAIGHAVVGDARYRGVRPGVKIARPFLHAQFLDFTHPFTNEEMHFEAPIPDDLLEVLRGLNISDS